MNVLDHPKVLISHHNGLWKAHNTFDNILAKEFSFLCHSDLLWLIQEGALVASLNNCTRATIRVGYKVLPMVNKHQHGYIHLLG